MSRILVRLCLAGAVLFSATSVPAQTGKPAAKGVAGAVHLLGLENVKRNATGQVSVESGAMTFNTKASKAELPLASVNNVSTGEETHQSGGAVGTVAKMAVPYGGGRALSLIMKTKVDVLTLEYQNADGAYHGAIVSVPKGQGEGLKSQLLAQGAHAKEMEFSERKPAQAAPAPAQAKTQPKITASAIQVEQIDAGDVALPAEFRVAIYENLIEELQKSGQFKTVYRSGDRRADGVADLVKLHTTLLKFQEGSQTKRAVTTVAGATKVDVRAQVTGKDGGSLLDRQVQGQVRFFGTNLRATLDLARSITRLFGKTA